MEERRRRTFGRHRGTQPGEGRSGSHAPTSRTRGTQRPAVTGLRPPTRRRCRPWVADVVLALGVLVVVAVAVAVLVPNVTRGEDVGAYAATPTSPSSPGAGATDVRTPAGVPAGPTGLPLAAPPFDAAPLFDAAPWVTEGPVDARSGGVRTRDPGNVAAAAPTFPSLLPAAWTTTRTTPTTPPRTILGPAVPPPATTVPPRPPTTAALPPP
ncbi:MAG: hypothetical protein JWQ26_719, partial [Modestobacter sp.]|nr:hypothetical protein [Modestobacter sp.]